MSQDDVIHWLFVGHLILAAATMAAAWFTAPFRVASAYLPRTILIAVSQAFLAVNGLVDPMPLIEVARPWYHFARVFALDGMLLIVAGCAVVMMRQAVGKQTAVTA